MADCLEDDPEKRPTLEEVDLRLKRINAENAIANDANKNKNAQLSLFDIFPRHIAEALRDGQQVSMRVCICLLFEAVLIMWHLLSG